MKSIAAPVIFLAMSAVLAPAFAQAPRGAADNNSALNGRLERLEEQVADLRGVVAAVETLAKNSGGGGGYSATSGGASSEQVRQLSEQIAELTRRLQRLEARSGSNTGGPGAEEQREQMGYNTIAPASGFEEKEQLPPLSDPQAEPDRLRLAARIQCSLAADGERRPIYCSASLLWCRRLFIGSRRNSPCAPPNAGRRCANGVIRQGSVRSGLRRIQPSRIFRGRDLFSAVHGSVSERCHGRRRTILAWGNGVFER